MLDTHLSAFFSHTLTSVLEPQCCGFTVRDTRILGGVMNPLRAQLTLGGICFLHTLNRASLFVLGVHPASPCQADGNLFLGSPPQLQGPQTPRSEPNPGAAVKMVGHQLELGLSPYTHGPINPVPAPASLAILLRVKKYVEGRSWSLPVGESPSTHAPGTSCSLNPPTSAL